MTRYHAKIEMAQANAFASQILNRCAVATIGMVNPNIRTTSCLLFGSFPVTSVLSEADSKSYNASCHSTTATFFLHFS